MNRVMRFYIVSMLCFSVDLFSIDSSRLLQREAVENKIKEIEKRVLMERSVVAATITAGLIYCGITFSAFINNHLDVTPKPPLVDKVKRSQDGFFRSMKNLFFTFDGWKMMGQFGCSLVGYTAWGIVTKKLFEKIWHPMTFRWYVYTHIPYNAVLTGMKDSIEALQKSDISVDQKKIYHDSLKVFCSQLTRYATCVCAYMLYKANGLFPEETILAQQMSVYFFNYHNDWMTEFIEQFEVDQPNYTALFERCIAYEKIIKRLCIQFSSIEGETSEERRAVAGE